MKKIKTMKIFLIHLVLFLTVHLVMGQEASVGSLAIDAINGNQYGWAVDYKTQTASKKRAIEECQKNGGNDCHTVLWFEGGCGVYVVDLDNPSLYGWGVANTRLEAESIAMAEARKIGGTNLKVRVWGCNDGNLIDSNQKPVSANFKGTYMFHYTTSSSDKKFFTSNLLYVPNVAKKENEKWYWSPSAESVITPKAVEFWDAVEANKYSYLTKEQRKKLITRNKNVDWVGASEIEYANAKINLNSLEDRKAIFQKFKEALTNQKRDEGFEIIEVIL